MKSSPGVNKNFHLPLPPALYSGLRDASARLGAPATDLAREAIGAWLKEEKRRRIKAELAAYVDAVAGSIDDHDPSIADAGGSAFLAAYPDDDWSFEGARTKPVARARAAAKKPASRRKNSS